jgi:tRNA(fMet)-specific endonuclease VapC
MNEKRRFLLDMNIIAALAKNPQGPVTKRIQEFGTESVCTSIIVACEIQFGLLKSGSEKLRNRMERILDSIEVVPLEPSVQTHTPIFAFIRSKPEHR